MNPSAVPGRKAKYAWNDIDRAEPPKRPAADRVSDFRQTHQPYDEAAARAQASRCIQCPNPRCVEACPLGTPIHELLAMMADGQFKEAAELLFVTHSIPELASHVCVGGRVCERACILADKSDPVPIRALTRFLLDYGWKHGLAEPAVERPKNRSVAIIGSGIGGLVTADTLSRRGYAVTVIDSRQKPGGRVMNGLPGFRVDKELVERRLELLRQRGIHFRMGVTFGQDVKLSDLRRQFDAVFLGFGLAEAMPLKTPGADLKGVHQAFPFVIQNAQPACGPAAGAKAGKSDVDVRGKRVVVLGGGDTAMDVLRIAIRLGAASALCVYRRQEAGLPADAEEYDDAREEGAKFMFLAQPVAVLGNKQGAVTGVRCVRMETGEPDSTGRAGVKPVAGSEFEIPADLVFVAFGFDVPRLPQVEDFAALSVDGRGCLVVDDNSMTNFPGVFASGSIVRGPLPLTDVVRGARRAAAAMDAWLTARR